ncbi:MAG TPA: hypothetical protein P5270_08510 [Victivallales bacterium]|nr:hypothetical protein [Victivallales bacterium]HRU00897.1 hypothetical protein [Victivallales bacterium]
MLKRRKLGPTYTRSPAQNIKESATNNFSKFIFAILYSIIALGALYVIVGVVTFLGTHFGNWDPETTTISIFNSPYCLPLKVICILGVFIYVFRDSLTKR